MLSSMQVRVLLKLVKPHLSNYSEAGPITPEEPCSFPLTQPTVGMLVDVPRLQEIGHADKIPVYMCFVGLPNAYV